MSDRGRAVCSHEFARRVWPARPEQVPTIGAEVARWIEPGIAPEPTGGAVLGQRGDGERRDGLLAAAMAAVHNVIRHAYRVGPGTVEIRFWVEADTAYLEVIDTGQWRGGTPAEVGRGMDLMRQRVDAVLIRRGRAGTRVLLRQRLTPPTEARSEPPQAPYPRAAAYGPVDHRGQQQYTPLAAGASDPEPVPLPAGATA